MMFHSEIITQVARNLYEMKAEVNSQLLATKNSAITEQVLPSIQNTLGMQGRGNNTIVHRRSRGDTGPPELGRPGNR